MFAAAVDARARVGVTVELMERVGTVYPSEYTTPKGID